MEHIQGESDTDNYCRCTMTVNTFSATVLCKNKLDGRQKAAQALLKVNNKYILTMYYYFYLFLCNFRNCTLTFTILVLY